MSATIRQCVIQLHPASLENCGGQPALAWQMREFIRFGVRHFLLLHPPGEAPPADDLIKAVQASLPLPAEISVLPALMQAKSLAPEILLCDGNSIFDANLAALLADAAAAPDRPGHILLPAGSTTTEGGILLLRRGAIAPHLGSATVARIIAALAASNQLGITWSDGCFAAAGTAAAATMPAKLRRRALFLDRDGVLNRDLGYVGSIARFNWIDGAIAGVAAATAAGWHVFVVTNQSGIARGYYTEADMVELMDWMGVKIHAQAGTIDDYRFCPFHPQAPLPAYRRESGWRKPAPGMLTDLIAHWGLNPARCHMIGDQPSDLQAAAAAGITAGLFTGGRLDGMITALLNEESR